MSNKPTLVYLLAQYTTVTTTHYLAPTTFFHHFPNGKSARIDCRLWFVDDTRHWNWSWHIHHPMVRLRRQSWVRQLQRSMIRGGHCWRHWDRRPVWRIPIYQLIPWRWWFFGVDELAAARVKSSKEERGEREGWQSVVDSSSTLMRAPNERGEKKLDSTRHKGVSSTVSSCE